MKLSRLFQLLCLVISLMSHFAYSQLSTSSQTPVYNQQLASLYDQGSVKLNAWLSHANSDIAVHEQVTLNIEVMADTWFTKGTKVHRVEVDNAVVLPMSSFAVNSTERIDGKVYSKQLWEIVLYPLQSGEYQIPPVALEIGVKQGSNNVDGVVMTKALSFNAHKPSAKMTSDQKWLTGTEANLKEKWTLVSQNESSQGLEEQLSVGDAITREITLSAHDTISALLPEITTLPDTLTSQFLVYPESTQYRDDEQRGVRQAQRLERVTYIVNNAGRVTLPAVSVFWWDSEFQQQRTLVLPERSWQVSHTFASFVEQYKALLAGLVVIVILSTALLYRYVKTRPKSKWLCLAQAIYNKDIPLFENSIYQVLLEHFQSRVLTPRVETVEGIEMIWQRYKKSPEHEKLRESKYSRLVLFKVLIAFLLSAKSGGLNR
ncbi:BatD family protein [Vibrio crassostreae]|uniref:BatD family protein n=1 Tax=Vibrio crassostreae TaxID=246167 RepID=UPI001B3094C1|nr:BatD family protein [Vibrio crassostreae]